MAAAITFGSLTAMAQAPDVRDIMARVARNQAASIEARKGFVYDEEEHVRLHRGNGKPAREEMRLYTVMPQQKDRSRELVKLEGSYSDGAKSGTYSNASFERKGLDIDAALVEAFFEDDPGDSVDGIPKDLFPLTEEEQAKYDYKLDGIESYHGRQACRISFQPKKGIAKNADHGEWKGEALIDAAAFQPLMVSTDLAWKVPLAVRTMLGTNLRGVGFSVTYQPFDGGVWFPVSYGGELEVRAVFFYKRTISVEMTAKNFRHADVKSSIAFEKN